MTPQPQVPWTYNPDMFVVVYEPFLPNGVKAEPVTLRGKRSLHISDSISAVLLHASPHEDKQTWHIRAWAVPQSTDTALTDLALAVEAADPARAFIDVLIEQTPGVSVNDQSHHPVRAPYAALWDALTEQIFRARALCDSLAIRRRIPGLQIDSVMLARYSTATGTWDGLPMRFDHRYGVARLAVGSRSEDDPALWTGSHPYELAEGTTPATADDFTQMFLACAQTLHRARFKFLFRMMDGSRTLVPGWGHTVAEAREEVLEHLASLVHAGVYPRIPKIELEPVNQDTRAFPTQEPAFTVLDA